MSAGIKALNYGSEICREWAASVKRTPLKKDVLRCVTVVKDGTVRTMGKINEFSFVEKTTPDGVKKIVTSTEGGKGRIKFVQYPNG